MEDHDTFMQMALEEAHKAALCGEVPVGAVLVRDQTVLARNYNRREQHQDPLAHAELSVIQEAAQKLNTWRLTGTTLYVTLEPCMMCTGALIQARIHTLVFGTWDPKAGACGSLLNGLEIPGLNHRVEMIAEIHKEPCRDILQKFFRELRQAPQAIHG